MSNVGTKIDELYQARSARLVLEKQVAALKADETTIKQEIMEQLKAEDLQGARGHTATASIQNKVRPEVEDWGLVYAYIKEHDLFALLHQRLTTTLWSAMQDDGDMVPGVRSVAYQDLSLTKTTRG